ncbi:sugar ABC transporter ATP-binding protein [Agrobacterium sp. MOPV5]|uniref:sugar ABC transporter ATP-binding protein n=1 Tax=Agrobacterium leguminum TaxID=2792015 RepID=UPI0018C1E96F|nr:sugar ABC transporter ATP-binding protein [Agrobacterium leguminum]MBG0511013.1 sugar ABC transporter ATP-binding protein [Agrobacterium leguminum]
MTAQQNHTLRVEGIQKRYGATLALDEVNFTVSKGKVHALLGENGAGKSTLVKLLSGLVRSDKGTIALNGKVLELKNPRDAHSSGIRTAFQELTLCPDLTVAQNFLLPKQPSYVWGTLKLREGERLVQDALTSLGITSVDPSEEVKTLDLATRQKLEIARAAYHRPHLVLLDEPTASLSGPDIDWLHRIVCDLRDNGSTILFISHRLPEVRRFCDTMTVLRNGRSVLDGPVDQSSDDTIIESIIGRSLSKAFPAKLPAPKDNPAASPVLEAREVCTGKAVSGVSFELHKGEILGVAALQGMGQQELFEALFGAVEITSGILHVHGRQTKLYSPRDALSPDVGISLVPEERKTDGLFLTMNGKINATLPVLSNFSTLGVLDTRRELKSVKRLFERVQVADRAISQPMSAFSGGNQQKVAIAKWLITESPILLMLDPTRGVDVGTKHEIYLLMQEYAKAGGAVLFYSTEIEEVVHLSTRVLVMYRGKIVSELREDRSEISEHAVMNAALGNSVSFAAGSVH